MGTQFQSTAPRTRPRHRWRSEARLETLELIDARLAALCADPAMTALNRPAGPTPGPHAPPVENDCKTSDLPPDMSALAGSNVRRGGHGRPPSIGLQYVPTHSRT